MLITFDTIKTFLATLILLVAVAPGIANGSDGDTSAWDFVVAPYIQVPWISGDTSVGRIEDAEVDVSPDDILDTLAIGGMLQLEAQHRSGLGFVLNYGFMKLEESIDGPAGYTNFDGEIFQGVMEGLLSYRVELENSPLDIYAGARWWNLHLDVSADNVLGNADADRTENWVDPIVGARVAPRIAEDWRVLIQGDVGGFDVSSDMTYRTMGGLLWDAGESFSLALLYSALWVDYGKGDPGNSDRFTYDTVTHGPLVGLVFRY